MADSYLRRYLAWSCRRCYSWSLVLVVVFGLVVRCSRVRLLSQVGAYLKSTMRWRIGCKRHRLENETVAKSAKSQRKYGHRWHIRITKLHSKVAVWRMQVEISAAVSRVPKRCYAERRVIVICHLWVSDDENYDIQSLRSRVCKGPWALRDRATQITTMPTTTTTTVAATGTAIFKSTQSGIQGNSIFTPGDSLIGAIVPRIQKKQRLYLYGNFLCPAIHKSQ